MIRGGRAHVPAQERLARVCVPRQESIAPRVARARGGGGVFTASAGSSRPAPPACAPRRPPVAHEPRAIGKCGFARILHDAEKLPRGYRRFFGRRRERCLLCASREATTEKSELERASEASVLAAEGRESGSAEFTVRLSA
jgi:hypothetical protein